MNVVASTAALEASEESGSTAQSKDWPAQSVAASSRHGPSATQLAASAIAGAVAAAFVAAAIVTVVPAHRVNDPQTLAVSRDVEDLKTQLLTLTARMEEMDTSAVAAAAPIKALDGTVKTQGTSLEALRQDLDTVIATAQRSGEEQAKIATPALLGIGVVQLRSAIDRGAPFDWELVTLFGIAGRRPDAAAELDRLRSLAGGVASQRQLLTALSNLAATADSGASAANRAIQTIQWLLRGPQPNGAATGGAPVSVAFALAENSDYAGAAKALRTLDPAIADVAEPVAVALERRSVAVGATAKLMAIARDGLSEQLRAVAQQQ